MHHCARRAGPPRMSLAASQCQALAATTTCVSLGVFAPLKWRDTKEGIARLPNLCTLRRHDIDAACEMYKVSVWSIWFVSSVWFISFNPTLETDQIDRTDETDRTDQ